MADIASGLCWPESCLLHSCLNLYSKLHLKYTLLLRRTDRSYFRRFVLFVHDFFQVLHVFLHLHIHRLLLFIGLHLLDFLVDFLFYFRLLFKPLIRNFGKVELIAVPSIHLTYYP